MRFDGGSALAEIRRVMRDLPVILVSCSSETIDTSGFGSLAHHAVFERYLDALLGAVPCAPLLFPGISCCPEQTGAWMAAADGVLLTGAAADVAPHLYGEAATSSRGLPDPGRDAAAIACVRAAIEHGVPLMGICRGLQELNVALGGSLHQKVHALAGRLDHRSSPAAPLTERYLPAHPIQLTPGGWLESLLSKHGVDANGLQVNSLHGQAADRLGAGVRVEARAPDGTVEAICVPDASALTFAVQWHPEWHLDISPLNAALFDEFGRACFARAQARRFFTGRSAVELQGAA